MEYPLTEPCPQCGAEMEPQGLIRRGQQVYECPECGYQTEVAMPAQAEDEDIEDTPP